MKSKSSVGDFAGYGISIGSILGVIAGVIIGNPGTGLFSGMLLGTAIGLILGRKKLMKVTLKSIDSKKR